MSKCVNEDLFLREESTNNAISVIANAIGGTDRSYNIALNIARYYKEPTSGRVNLRRLAQATKGELLRIDGIGTKTASILSSIIDLSKKINSYTEHSTEINSPEDAYQILQDMRYLNHEEFRVIILDTKNKIKAIETVTRGILDASLLHPREIFKIAIDNIASSIILVHNHPSGNTSPSAQDIEITKNIVAAGKILNIEVIDHLIIGDGKLKFLSLKEKRLM